MQHKNDAETSGASNFKAKRWLNGKITCLDVSRHIEVTTLATANSRQVPLNAGLMTTTKPRWAGDVNANATETCWFQINHADVALHQQRAR